MSKNASPQLAGCIFCNSASEDSGGKVNCRGVFTSFLAWAYPTSIRSWHVILTIYKLPEGTTTISVAISYGRGEKTTLATLDVQRGKVDVGSVINLPLRHRFEKEGFYTVHVSVLGSTATLKVPVKVATKRWPHFSRKQLQFLKDNPSVPHSLRANILCSTCSRPFILEESVLPDAELADGVLPFPDTGQIECESCGHILHVKDIQGQLLASIKNAVSEAMRGGK